MQAGGALRRIGAVVALLVASTLAWVPTPAEAATPASAVLSSAGYNLTTTFGTAIDNSRSLLFVTDQGHHRVLVYNLDTAGLPTSTTPAYVIGQPDTTTYTAGTSAQKFDTPAGLAFDPTTRYLYVVDRNNNRVVVFNTSTLTNNPSAIFALGQDTLSNKAGVTDQFHLYNPRAVALDNVGQRLFVSETNSNRVVTFNLANLGSYLGTNTSMPASNVIGQSNFTNVASATSQNRFRVAGALAYDPSTRYLYVADNGTANRVLVFDATSVTDSEPAINVIGAPDFTTNGGAASRSSFGSVRSLGIDSAGGRLFVGDGTGNRVLTFDIRSLTNFPAANDLFGQTLWTDTVAGSTSDRLTSPADVFFDAWKDRIIVSDSGNSRISIFSTAYRLGETVLTAQIQPILSFTIAGATTTCDGLAVDVASTATALPLGSVVAGSTRTAGQLLTISSNASTGVVVKVAASGPMRSASGRDITAISGSNATPGAFASGEGFGYTATDATLSTGTLNRFTSDATNRWAAFGTTAFEVASTSGPTSMSSSCLAARLTAAPTTPAGVYATTLTYTAVPTF